jgi:hypothetical protein
MGTSFLVYAKIAHEKATSCRGCNMLMKEINRHEGKRNHYGYK